MFLRSLLSVDTPSAEVSIARAELARLIEMCADVRQKLHRNNKVIAANANGLVFTNVSLISMAMVSQQSVNMVSQLSENHFVRFRCYRDIFCQTYSPD